MDGLLERTYLGLELLEVCLFLAPILLDLLLRL